MTLSRTTVPYISIINIGDFHSFKQSESQHASHVMSRGLLCFFSRRDRPLFAPDLQLVPNARGFDLWMER